jgi:hypothetical protein
MMPGRIEHQTALSAPDVQEPLARAQAKLLADVLEIPFRAASRSSSGKVKYAHEYTMRASSQSAKKSLEVS